MLTLNTNRGRQFAAALIAGGPPSLHADRLRAPAGKKKKTKKKTPAYLLVELRRREGINSQRRVEENTFRLLTESTWLMDGRGIPWVRKEMKLLMKPAEASDPPPPCPTHTHALLHDSPFCFSTALLISPNRPGSVSV